MSASGDPIAPPAVEPAAPPGAPDGAGYRALAVFVLAYIGVYLCRKNFSVAIPLLQAHFGATKAQVGTIATVGTIAYFAGKFVTGPVVDALGGRRGLLLSMLVVGIFGAAGAFAPGLVVLALVYGVNRFAGSASWGAMLKLVPTWFGKERLGTAVAILSLSYVAGSALATMLATALATGVVSAGGDWRVVMGAPAVVLAAILAVSFFGVRKGPLTPPQKAEAGPRPALGPVLLALLARRQFLVTCALSFTLTLVRETFNTWSFDFLASLQGGGPEGYVKAGWQSTFFDWAGAVSILAAGVAYDKVAPSRRRFWMAGCLSLLAWVIGALPTVAATSPGGAAVLVGLVGLLVYGPYSLLGGALAIESGGEEAAATAAGVIDGVGYIGGALAGTALGGLVDAGGYALGFRVLAGMTVISAAISMGLTPARKGEEARAALDAEGGGG